MSPIQSSKEFKINNYRCEFLEHNFPDHFDGFIEGNILHDLNAIISYAEKKIMLNNVNL